MTRKASATGLLRAVWTGCLSRSVRAAAAPSVVSAAYLAAHFEVQQRLLVALELGPLDVVQREGRAGAFEGHRHLSEFAPELLRVAQVEMAPEQLQPLLRHALLWKHQVCQLAQQALESLKADRVAALRMLLEDRAERLRVESLGQDLELPTEQNPVALLEVLSLFLEVLEGVHIPAHCDVLETVVAEHLLQRRVALAVRTVQAEPLDLLADGEELVFKRLDGRSVRRGYL